MPLDPHRLNPTTEITAPGLTLATDDPVTWVVPVHGCARWRHRFEASENGTLDYAYGRPTPHANIVPTPYTANNPSQVSVTADTETGTDEEHFGEDWVLITFTPSTTGAIITVNDMSRV